MAYCDDENPAIFPDITYGFYKVFAQINNIPYQEIPLKNDFTIDLGEYKQKSGTIFIANPNAPTGILLSLDEIEDLVLSNQKRIVVVDEAYIDFGGQSAVNLTKKYKNLLITRTFSKSRSMAGARLGFGVGDKDLINDLKAVKYSLNPYNVNSVTASAGVGSIEDKKYFEDNCQAIIKNREWTENALKELGFSLTQSKANFVFAKTDKISGKDLYLKLKDKGILVRHFDKDKIKEYNRITIGDAKEMQAFVNAVKSILEEVQ
jgi:histidinol-phosphate aminotransferase